MLQQVSLSQLQASVADEFKFSEFESYDSDFDGTRIRFAIRCTRRFILIEKENKK